MLVNCIIVGCGGFCGSILRYLVSKIQRAGSFPIGTLIVNVVGAILIGIIIGFAEKNGLSEQKILFLKVGLCGGLTTFSTFTVETFNYIEQGNWIMGIGYSVLSLVLCLIGVYFGLKIA